jgi:hypothetical protein
VECLLQCRLRPDGRHVRVAEVARGQAAKVVSLRHGGHDGDRRHAPEEALPVDDESALDVRLGEERGNLPSRNARFEDARVEKSLAQVHG